MALTRYAGNPIFEQSGSDAWDYSKSIVTVLRFGINDYRMWYNAGENDVEVRRRPAYAVSTDGLTWTKPNLGIVSFGGNSNNNLLLDTMNRFTSLTHDAANGRYLMMLAYAEAAADYGIHIYSSDDGIIFTLLKTVITATAFGTNCEGRDLVQRSDGRWIAYYSTGHAADLRNVGAFLSDTSDITGAWTHIGPVLVNVGSTSQRYGITVQPFAGIYLGYVLRYNSTTERLVIDLYRSRDGLNWSVVETNWLPLGASGQWDDEVVYLGKALVQAGDNEWRFYYAGWPENHATDSARQVGFGTVTQSDVNSYVGLPMALATDVVAQYPLSSVAAGIGGLNLTNNGTITFVSGKVGNAANLVAASSQYLSHADNATFDMGDIDFTILCWLRLASKPANSMCALAKFVSTGNQRGYQLQWNQAADRFLFQISPDGTSGAAITATASNFGAPALDTWYLLACRHNAAANIMSISVNAGTPNTAAITGGAFVNTAPFEIGRLNAANYWNGLIDEVLIAKRVFSDAEVSSIYNNGDGVPLAFIQGAGNIAVVNSEGMQSALFGGQLAR